MNPVLIGAIVVAVWAYLKQNQGALSFPILNFGRPATGVTTSFSPPATTGTPAANAPTAPQIQPSASSSGVPAFAPQSRASWNPNVPQYGNYYNPGQFNRPTISMPRPAPTSCGCGSSSTNGCSSCSTCKSAGRGNCQGSGGGCPGGGSGVASGPRGNQPVTLQGQVVTAANLQQFGDATAFQAYMQQLMDMEANEGGTPAGHVRGHYQPQ